MKKKLGALVFFFFMYLYSSPQVCFWIFSEIEFLIEERDTKIFVISSFEISQRYIDFIFYRQVYS